MPFCPVCGAEYRQGFTVCSDCNVALAERLYPEPAGPRVPLASIEVICPPLLVEAIKDLLMQNDIFCGLQDSYTAAQYAGRSAMPDLRTRLLVPEARLEDAKEMIHDFLDETGDDSRRVSCAHCGASVPEWKIVCPGCGRNLREE